MIFDKRYMGFVKKNEDGDLTNTVSTNCKQAKKLLESLNSLSNKKEQADAIVGLALHTLQDYYAHLVQVKECNYGKTKIRDVSITKLNYKITPNTTSQLEDNPSFLSWRYNDVKWITQNVIYDCYKHNREILKIGLYAKKIKRTEFYIKWDNKENKIGFYSKGIPKNKSYTKYTLLYKYFSLYVDTNNMFYYA